MKLLKLNPETRLHEVVTEGNDINILNALKYELNYKKTRPEHLLIADNKYSELYQKLEMLKYGT